MPNDTCVEGGCDRPRLARSLCSRHYRIARSEGRLETVRARPRHALTDVDANAATATCAACGPVEIRVRVDGKSHECMTLRRVSRNRSAGAVPRRVENLRTKYGLTLEEYQDMSERQGGLCAICFTAQRKLVVDHDHKTGLVRQLLCSHCNSALGFLRDDVQTARYAVEYILRHSTA